MNKEAECKCEDAPKPMFGDYAKVNIYYNTPSWSLNTGTFTNFLLLVKKISVLIKWFYNKYCIKNKFYI